MSSDVMAIPDMRAERRPWVETLHDWVTTVDHKRIGLLYIFYALLFLVIAGGEALIIRIQLMFPHNDFVSPQVFNRMFTMHGTTMIFFFAMPILFGIGNYLVPLMIGAIPGAMPPLIGWAAARGALSAEAWLLFAVVFLWQFPHFMAIAWMYREDYDRAGYKVLPRGQVRVPVVILQTLLPLIALVFVSLVPALTGGAGVLRTGVILLAGLGFLTCGLQFVSRRHAGSCSPPSSTFQLSFYS